MTERCYPCLLKALGIGLFSEIKDTFRNLSSGSCWKRKTRVLATRRSNQKQQYPQDFRKLQVRLRRRIETTLNQLTQQFSVGRVRARTHWGLSTRMSNKFGACLLGAFLNQCLRRPLMKLKDLVLA